MKKHISTIWLLGIIVASVLLIWGISRGVHDRIAAGIREDFEGKIREFEDTVDDDLYDFVCDISPDIKYADTTGRVDVHPVRRGSISWYEFNTYIDIRIYVKRDMSSMDPFEIRAYLEPLDRQVKVVSRTYQQTDFPLAYYRTEEGLDKLGKYLYNVSYIPAPVMTEVYVIDANGDEYRYAGHYAYYVNGECVEKPFLSSLTNSSSGSSGSGHSSSGSNHSSSGAYPDCYDYAWDIDDYDNPDDYADDAWGEDFDDWDDAYDYWEDNY